MAKRRKKKQKARELTEQNIIDIDSKRDERRQKLRKQAEAERAKRGEKSIMHIDLPIANTRNSIFCIVFLLKTSTSGYSGNIAKRFIFNPIGAEFLNQFIKFCHLLTFVRRKLFFISSSTFWRIISPSRFSSLSRNSKRPRLTAIFLHFSS